MKSDEQRHQAVLLLGPTGSGKTPLGELFERNGWRGHDCLHFDFGENLRLIADGRVSAEGVGPDDIDFIRRVLDGGALLEDEHFPLARRVFESFLERRQKGSPAGDDSRPLIVLNGLPRHVGQAESVAAIVEVVAVVRLRCSASAVAARIRGNVGGDRTGREDDDMEFVAEKLRIFAARTEPLVDFYRSKGVIIETVEVEAGTTPQDAWGQVARGGLGEQ